MQFWLVFAFCLCEDFDLPLFATIGTIFGDGRLRIGYH